VSSGNTAHRKAPCIVVGGATAQHRHPIDCAAEDEDAGSAALIFRVRLSTLEYHDDDDEGCSVSKNPSEGTRPSCVASGTTRDGKWLWKSSFSSC
jgi:hypothetical protein